MDEYSPQPPRPLPAPAPHTRSSLPTLLAVFFVLAIIWFVPYLAENVQYGLTRGRERAEVESARAELDGNDKLSFVRAFEQVAKSIGPSVVHIDTVKAMNGARDEFSGFFGGGGRYAEEQGSGVIIDGEGYILTNNHVVQGAEQLRVSLSDGRKLEGDVVGGDPATDLAVIKINADGLLPAPWGDSDSLPVGAPVWAVGNPYGLDRSVTFGIISAKSRRGVGASPYQEFLQTDAAVNPGNSGGPLVDVQGQVVGINTAIVGRAYQGISFAIPSETAHHIYDQLRANKHVVRGYLGVQLTPDEKLTPQLAQKLGLKDTHGALVSDVVSGDPADAAGIEPGDVIVKWDGHAVDSATTLQLLIARSAVGSEVKCELLRDGEPLTKTVRVGERQKSVPMQFKKR